MHEPDQNPPAGFDDLSVDEQIVYVQRLWDRIAARSNRVPVPEWHVRELRERQQEYRNDPDKVRSWDEVRERILRRRDDAP
ncbi:MAG: addiction module protein [Planctomycetes bacterium]|nr:addiction module protein [Planctomycetota bacterium]